ncbi:MAG: TrmH family RNA methyltransferase [Gemmatimonadota bacterium]
MIEPPHHPELVERYRRARRDRGLAVLEGFHALKHAMRFGADPEEAVCRDPAALADLARRLAPDVAERVTALVSPVPGQLFERLSPHPPPSGVIALARRPQVDVDRLLARPGPAPVVLLERPRHLGNLGAAVRVTAAAGAAGLLATGEHDPWHPTAVRGAAGLHFALPVVRLDEPGTPRGESPPRTERGSGDLASRLRDRPLVALDPSGEPLRPGLIPDRAVLAFGSERRGLSTALLDASDLRVALPMRPGVSSLNLATAVAATLYARRICG